MSHKEIEIGDYFGSWCVLEQYYGKTSMRGKHYKCECSCGTVKIIDRSTLINKRSTQCINCGNKQKAKKSKAVCTTHGKTNTKEFRIWCAMKNRCFNKNSSDYHRYGGRGITICKRWLSFANFLSDMEECPKGKTIDRIDNDGNYEPKNCKWSTAKQQARNRTHRGTHFYKNKKTKPWCSSIMKDGISYFLGCFETEEQAHQAYLRAKTKYHKSKRKRKSV